MGFQPDVGEQITEVWRVGGRLIGWSFGEWVRVGAASFGKFGQQRVEPGPGFNAAEFCAGDDAEQDGRALAAQLAAYEEPVFTSDGREYHHSFGEIIVDRQSAAFGVAA